MVDREMSRPWLLASHDFLHVIRRDLSFPADAEDIIKREAYAAVLEVIPMSPLVVHAEPSKSEEWIILIPRFADDSGGCVADVT